MSETRRLEPVRRPLFEMWRIRYPIGDLSSERFHVGWTMIRLHARWARLEENFEYECKPCHYYGTDDRAEFLHQRRIVVTKYTPDERTYANVPEYNEMASWWINPQTRKLDKVGDDFDCTVSLALYLRLALSWEQNAKDILNIFGLKTEEELKDWEKELDKLFKQYNMKARDVLVILDGAKAAAAVPDKIESPMEEPDISVE